MSERTDALIEKLIIEAQITQFPERYGVVNDGLIKTVNALKSEISHMEVALHKIAGHDAGTGTNADGDPDACFDCLDMKRIACLVIKESEERMK